MNDLFSKLPADFGRYRILRKLGEGGMGAVYLAEDTKLRNRKTAIKLPTKKLEGADAARFQREAEASAIIDHPHICPVYDVGTISGRQYLAMKFIEGRPLAAHVGKDKLWSAESALTLVGKLAGAFQFAHDEGVIHRDIKPANIMLTAANEPVIMDFGLAKLSGDPTMTSVGSVFGTPNFMPLEQALGDTKMIGPHSDVYSLGVIFFQMLTGELPFPGDSVMAVFASLAVNDVPALRAKLPEADPHLEAVLLKAMAKQWKDRYATMREFGEALAGCRQPQLASVHFAASQEELSLSVPVPMIKTPVPTIVPLEAESRSPHSTLQNPRSARVKYVWAGLLTMIIGVAVWGLQLDGPPKEKFVEVIPDPPKPKPTPPMPEPKKEPMPEPKKELVPVPTPEVKAEPTVVVPPMPRVEPKNPFKEPEKTSPPMTPVEPKVVPKPIPTAGEERSFDLGNGVKMVFCFIPKGECQLGSPKAERDAVLKQIKEEKEPVWLAAEAEEVRGKFTTNGFWLGKTEVTQEQWTAIVGTNPSYFNGMKDNEAKGLNTAQFPVETVSWDECQEFLTKLNQRGGTAKVFDSASKFVLPHEDQWEYASRGGLGNRRPFYWGNSLNGDRANCDGNYPYGTTEKGEYKKRPAPVGSYAVLAPHPWGLSDMSGNVWEWCESKYSNDGTARVCRGGSWFDYPVYCRVARRDWYEPGHGGFTLGFRVVFCLD